MCRLATVDNCPRPGDQGHPSTAHQGRYGHSVLAFPRRAVSNIPLWGLWTGTIICSGIAIWLSIGPWTVHVDGSTFNCGHPFDGAYRVGNPDIAATGYYTCWQQARYLLPLAFGFIVLGFVGFVWSCWRMQSDDAEVARRTQENALRS